MTLCGEEANGVSNQEWPKLSRNGREMGCLVMMVNGKRLMEDRFSRVAEDMLAEGKSG
jgi:hypothetical protein